MQPILSAREVTFLDILRYPDIDIYPGQVTFLCGDSGCGKSTLLRLWCALASPSGGQLTYAGQDIAELDTVALRREVLLAGQSIYLFDADIRSNFAEYYRYREQAPPEDAVIHHHLDLCCAPFPLESDTTALSGGERQRVFLAICLSLNPKVLLLDEPTSALDADTAAALMHTLLQHCKMQGITPVIVSHDRTLAQRFADTIIQLEGKA